MAYKYKMVEKQTTVLFILILTVSVAHISAHTLISLVQSEYVKH